MLREIEREKLRDVVADRLRRFIVEEQLKPGDRLPTELELANRFGVSRLSLREATKSLEFLGIVNAKPGRGLRVGSVNMDRVTEYLGFHPELQTLSPDVLIDTRVIVETGVLTHVSSKMQSDPTIASRLRSINQQLRETTEVNRWIELDAAFHRELITSSGLKPLLAFSDLLSIFFHRFRERVSKSNWEAGIASHERIVEFLLAQKVTEAAAELRAHIESHRQPLESPLN